MFKESIIGVIRFSRSVEELDDVEAFLSVTNECTLAKEDVKEGYIVLAMLSLSKLDNLGGFVACNKSNGTKYMVLQLRIRLQYSSAQHVRSSPSLWASTNP
jgi:hypothetical protein